MGYDHGRFIGEIDEEFHCSICTLVLENPAQTPCDHTFCDRCIKEWISINQKCPVDRRSLAITDLKPPSRCFRNLLNKLELKCDFNQCQAIVKLENLHNHRCSCEFNPDSETICDKGCNTKITRREYEDNNCFAHLSKRVSRYEEQITKLIDDMSCLQEQNKILRVEMSSHQKQIAKLTVGPQRENNPKYSNILRNASPKFRKSDNMKISINRPDIFQVDNMIFTFAQFLHPLEPANASFKIEILNITDIGWIAMGLTRREHPSEKSAGFDEGSIGYFSLGKIYVDDNCPFENVRSWNNGDVVECGIRFPQNFINDVNYHVEVYFSINGQQVREELVKIPSDGFFPKVSMRNSGARVKYLTN